MSFESLGAALADRVVATATARLAVAKATVFELTMSCRFSGCLAEPQPSPSGARSATRARKSFMAASAARSNPVTPTWRR